MLINTFKKLVVSGHCTTCNVRIFDNPLVCDGKQRRQQAEVRTLLLITTTTCWIQHLYRDNDGVRIPGQGCFLVRKKIQFVLLDECPTMESSIEKKKLIKVFFRFRLPKFVWMALLQGYILLKSPQILGMNEARFNFYFIP